MIKEKSNVLIITISLIGDFIDEIEKNIGTKTHDFPIGNTYAVDFLSNRY